jgi:hypothetical protein
LRPSFLDIQDRVSYSSTMQKQWLIKKAYKAAEQAIGGEA